MDNINFVSPKANEKSSIFTFFGLLSQQNRQRKIRLPRAAVASIVGCHFKS
jgi:hypothetical protein